MGRTPEQPNGYEGDSDESHERGSLGLSRGWQIATLLGIMGATAAGLYATHSSDQTRSPRVHATLAPVKDAPTMIHLTTDQGMPIDVPSGTKVEAFCFNLRDNHGFGSYRFIIDEGLYNGQVAHIGREQLQSNTDPHPGAGMGRPDDPFSGLPLC